MTAVFPPAEDEMFSDIYKITESKDGMFYEVEGRVSHRCF